MNDWVLSDGSRADAVLTMHCNLAVAFKLLQGELKFIFVLGMCRLRGAQITAEFWFHEEDWEPHVLAAYVRHVAQSSGPGRSTTLGWHSLPTAASESVSSRLRRDSASMGLGPLAPLFSLIVGRHHGILATPSFHVEAGKIKAQLGATAFATARRYGID